MKIRRVLRVIISKFTIPLTIVTGICLSLTVTVVLCVSCADDRRKPEAARVQLEGAPLTITASTIGQFAEGFSWHLSVNSAREAELTIDTFPQQTRRGFEIPRVLMDEFRRALVEERFFELAGDYGEHVPDGSTQSLTVTAGQHTNMVKVHFLMNWIHDKSRLREPSRALRLLLLLRDWFEEPQAVDLRKHHRMILEFAA